MSLRLRSAVHPANFGLVAGAQPLRTRARRGNAWSYDGHFASTKALGPAPFESLLERDFQTLLDIDARIKCYAAQPHQLTYWAPDPQGRLVKRTYTPDYVALDRDGRIIVIEVKAKGLAERSNWTAREPHIRRAYEDEHGANFLLFTEEEIRVQPRLANCQIILNHARSPRDPAADLVIREIIFRVAGELSIKQICTSALRKSVDDRRSFAALMLLATEGVVKLDLSRPLSLATRVVAGGRA